MMDALQWFGFIGTVVGYAIFTKSRVWGAALSLIGVTALGMWAFILGAWGVLALELAFVAINLWVLWGCWRGRTPTDAIDAVTAIRFVLTLDDFYDQRDFLDGWAHGEWALLRESYPEFGSFK